MALSTRLALGLLSSLEFNYLVIYSIHHFTLFTLMASGSKKMDTRQNVISIRYHGVGLQWLEQ